MNSESIMYRCGPHQRFPLGPGYEFVRFPLVGAGRTLSSLEAGALSRWTEFSTIESAARDAIAVLPSLTFDGAVTLFTEIQRQGGLTGIADVIPSMQPEQRSDGRIQSLTIPTTGRSNLLKRCITSYARNLHDSGRRADLFIADSSTDGSTVEQLKLAAPGWPGAVSYAGPDEKFAFAEALSGHIPRGVIEYALFGSGDSMSGPGANRNSNLLFTLGSMTLSVDDDSVCEGACVPETSHAAVAFGGHYRTDEIWCYADTEAIGRSTVPCELDVFEQHESVLGIDLREVLWRARNAGKSIELQRMCDHIFNSLLMGTGRIALSSNGARGDSGFHSDLPIIGHNSPATRRRLQELGGAYCRTVSSRLTVRQSRSLAITHPEATCSGMHLGIDNRSLDGDLLPPFPSDYKSEDSIFFHLLGHCSEDRYSAHLPFTLAHWPESDRSYSAERGTRFRVADVLVWCAGTWRPAIGDRTASARLRSLGRYLQELADQETEAWRETVVHLAYSWRSATIQRLDAMMADSLPREDVWAQDISNRLGILRREAESDSFVPADLNGMEGDQANDLLRSAVRNYGALLEWWPAIIETTRSLSAAGTPFGLQISTAS